MAYNAVLVEWEAIACSGNDVPMIFTINNKYNGIVII